MLTLGPLRHLLIGAIPSLHFTVIHAVSVYFYSQDKLPYIFISLPGKIHPNPI